MDEISRCIELSGVQLWRVGEGSPAIRQEWGETRGEGGAVERGVRAGVNWGRGLSDCLRSVCDNTIT